MKLVSGCALNSANEELVLKEYLAYKIYNMITDFSFRVRLAKIKLKEVSGKEYSQYGFFIEDVDDMAKRLNCREYKKQIKGSWLTDKVQMTMVSIYQYMIGNTDWSLPSSHNIKFVQLRNDTASFPYTVPYDFDYSGLVNAPYAIPQPEFNIERVTDRIYRGTPSSPGEIESILSIFRERKDFITALVTNFEPLKKGAKESMLNYINDFYESINDKKTVRDLFVEGRPK